MLGVKATHLRGSQLRDLIFRVEGEAAKAQSCYVKLVFQSDDGEETEFKRTISKDNEAFFSINEQKQSWDDYNEQLTNLNIIVKAKNFLVFQVCLTNERTWPYLLLIGRCWIDCNKVA